jgi:hypothetical protein
MCMLMKLRFTKSFIICSCLVVLATLQSAAQDKTTIKGIVKDSVSGKGISYATAGLYRTVQQEKAVKNLFTNDKGEFVFTQVDTGNYVVIVTHASYGEKISAVIAVTTSTAIGRCNG